MEILTEVIGWIGTVLIVLAYYLVSTNKISGTSRNYQLLNVFGALAVGVNVFKQAAWPAFTLEVVWVLIAIYSLIKHRK
ncbi:MAG: hypothetical protein JJE53_01090 [Candidatus Pacebacteria bacterium]|nr:hypothetical protein [Candidatus Paceibacterota bacterium]